MPKAIYDRGMLKPAELAKLQRVFDAACVARDLPPDSPASRDMALDILALYQAGMEDEADLVHAFTFRRDRPKGA